MTPSYKFGIDRFFGEAEIEVSSFGNNHPFLRWAVDALRWYIFTQRASADFEKALTKVNTHRFLLDIGATGASTDEYIIRCKKYLHKHCKYNEAP